MLTGNAIGAGYDCLEVLEVGWEGWKAIIDALGLDGLSRSVRHLVSERACYVVLLCLDPQAWLRQIDL